MKTYHHYQNLNNMETVEEKRIGKYLIKIIPDTEPESPDQWDDVFGSLVYDHRQFYVSKKGFEPRDIFDHLNTGKKTYDGYWAFVVYAYIHGGVALSVGSHNFPDAQWDVSTTGFALIKREKGMYTREKALKAAKSLIETWNQYLSGDVYGYQICEVDDDGEENELDSCWGFYGQDECMKEAESIVEYYMKKPEVQPA